MQKESIKFSESLVFEGMTSIRAIISAIDAGINDRKINTILYDGSKAAKNAKTLGYLKAVSSKYNYELKETTAEHLSGIDQFVHAVAAFRQYDGFVALGIFSVNMAHHALVHRYW